MKKSKKMGLWLLFVTIFQTPLTELFGASAKKKSPVVVSSKKVAKNAPHKTPKNHSNIPKKEPSVHTTLVGKGRACIYSHSLNGSATASGEKFNEKALTAAHLTLPLGYECARNEHRNREIGGGSHQ
jgi:rare lipoprotein A (peptidoglycan hydrolase)